MSKITAIIGLLLLNIVTLVLLNQVRFRYNRLAKLSDILGKTIIENTATPLCKKIQAL